MRLALAALVALGTGAAQARDLSALQAELGTIAQGVGGTLGVGVRHLGSGEELYLNRGARFPMGSLFKVPLAVEVLARVEKGTLSLEQQVPVQASDLRPGSGRLVKTFSGPQAMPLRALLELTLIDSDNTATDLLWKEAGGAPAVMARLALLEVKGINVARPTGGLIAAAMGLEGIAGSIEITPSSIEELIRQVPRHRRQGEIESFLKDERDTATPEGYVALLSRIGRGEALDAANSALLLDIMQRCATGRGRLRAGLPRGTRIAHKTGTLRPHVTNDAGIVTLPGGGQVVIVVLLRESPQDLAAQERAIAAAGRAVYRHFSQ